MLRGQRSTVSLVARSLQPAGLISQSGGIITVLDQAGLEEATCACNGVIRES
jgi:hypothetical protein